MNLDNDGAAAAAAAVAMADVGLDATPPTTADNNAGNANAGNDGNGGNGAPTPIENDPLSMGQAGVAHSHSQHSSESASASVDVIQMEGIPAANTGTTMNTMNTTLTGNGPTGGANNPVGNNGGMGGTMNAMGTMGTTITVTMAAAAQQAWDQFVAGQDNTEAHQVLTPQQQQAQQQAQQQQIQFQHQRQLSQQQEAMAMEGITARGVQAMTVGGSGMGGRHYSPSSIPQASSASTAHSIGVRRGSPTASGTLQGQPNVNDAIPTTYQQLLLQQQRQDILSANSNSDPLSVHSAPAGTAANNTAGAASGITSSATEQMATAQQRATRRAGGQAVPRPASFGGFPTPPGTSSRPTAIAVVAENSPLAPTMEELQVVQPQVNFPSSVVTPPAHSRSNSAASSLTGSIHSSVHSSATTAQSSYQRFLSSLQHNEASSPLETIPPSEGDASSPQETFGSIHTSSEFSSPATFASPAAGGLSPGDDSKVSVGELSRISNASNASLGSGGNNFVKLPYSPSLLDQTSFPEEDLSVGDNEDNDMGDKYSPISKLDWSNADGEVGKTIDTTADTTMEDSPANDNGIQGLSHVSHGIASHVIHEDNALTADAPPATTTLRPRPSAFARANSTSSSSSRSNQGIPGTTTASTGASGVTSSRARTVLVRNEAFDNSPAHRPQYRHQISDVSIASNDGSVQLLVTPPPLSFGSDTTIGDLTYYAEKGCIVDVLAALTNPHLKTLGSRMLADYAKMPHRRVAVASNTRILEFVQRTALEIGSPPNNQQYYPNAHGAPRTSSTYEHVAKYTSPSWLGREYAVETVRSLTAAEENDRYLMNAPGLLQMLALVARGGPFIQHATSSTGYPSEPVVVAVPPPTFKDNGTPGPRLMIDNTMGVGSDKARLHACIAIMNLSCGKSNKIEITSVKQILEAMRDVMLGRHFSSSPRDSSSSSRSSSNVADEARLKATTCIKNLSNADANDAALLGTPGLVETLGYVAEATCHPRSGATTCTTHACLALMNLSISKANKNRVFRTPGVMDALMAVITRTAPRTASAMEPTNPKDPNFEARVKACSALSNLAIGYDNKIPMFNYPGFVESILTVIRTDKAEARTKACSILWSFAAEMKNQVPVVQRGDILPALVSVAKEDTKTEARFKCVAALTLLAESPENAVPLLRAGSLEPLMNVLQEAGPDPTQWRGQTASWCVGFLMNMAQCDDVVPALLQEGIVDLLAPLLSLDHYQSLKAAMAVTFVCQYDTGDKTYNLLRQTENVIPKIVGLLHNTLSGRGGSGYKYGVFTLRSSVGCIASLAAGPDFMKERIATNPVFESLLKVVEDFCVDGGTPGAIVGGGKDDTRSVTLAVRALSLLVGHLIPEPHCAAMPFGPAMDDQLITALRSFETNTHLEIDTNMRKLAHEARIRVEGGKNLHGHHKDSVSSDSSPDDLSDDGGGIGLSLARRFFPFPCGMNLHVPSDPTPSVAALPLPMKGDNMEVSDDAASDASNGGDGSAVRTFLLTDARTGRRFAVPCDPAGGRQFNDNRLWCFRRGRYCNEGEVPDSNFLWSEELQVAYKMALNGNVTDSNTTSSQC